MKKCHKSIGNLQSAVERNKMQSSRLSTAAVIFAATIMTNSVANAAVITFETGKLGYLHSDQVIEDGFSYTMASGDLVVYPGSQSKYLLSYLDIGTLSSDILLATGTLSIKSATPGGLFTLRGLDAAAKTWNNPFTNQPTSLGITLTGNLNGKYVSTDTLILNGGLSGLNPEAWTHQNSAALTDLVFDELLIELPGFYTPLGIYG